MSRHRPSNLYQVDFIAALFSGFLLIWLASAADTNFTAGDSPGPVFYMLEAKLYYGSPHDSVDRAVWISALPDAALHESCAPAELMVLVRRRLHWLGNCTYNDTKPRRPGEQAETLMATVKQRAGEVGLKLSRNVIPTLGLGIRLLDDGAGDQANYPTIGLALAKISDGDNSSYWARHIPGAETDLEHVHIGIGIIPDRKRIPTRIEADAAPLVRSAIFGINPSAGFSSPSRAAAPEGVVYTFEQISSGFQLTREFPVVLKLEVRLIVDPTGEQQCLTQEFAWRLPKATQKPKLEPVQC